MQDVQNFKQIIKEHIKSFQTEYQNTYFIVDAARYTRLPMHYNKRGNFYYQRAEEAKRGKAFDGQRKCNRFGYCQTMTAMVIGQRHSMGGVDQRWLLFKSINKLSPEKNIP